MHSTRTTRTPARPSRSWRLGGLALAAVLAGSTLVPLLGSPPTAAADVIPLNGRIAFASAADGDLDLYTINPDGTGRKNLTPGSGANDTMPAWSGDGRIAFASDRDGDMDLYVMNADGSGVRQITDSPGFDGRPTWSPDRTRLAFASDRSGHRQVHVVRVDLIQLPTTQLTAAGTNLDPDWGPDGRIAFASDRSGDREIFVMPADGSTQAPVTANGVDDRNPRWRSATRLVLQRNVGGGDPELVEVDAVGGGLAVLTSNDRPDHMPAPSPDRARTAFIVGTGAAQELHVTPAGGGSGSVRLTNDGAKDEFPDWERKRVNVDVEQEISEVSATTAGLSATVTFTTRVPTDQARVELWNGDQVRFAISHGAPTTSHQLTVFSLTPETSYVLKVVAPKVRTSGSLVYTHATKPKTLTRKVTVTYRYADVIDDGDANSCGELRLDMTAAGVEASSGRSDACDGGTWNPVNRSVVLDHIEREELAVTFRASEDDLPHGNFDLADGGTTVDLLGDPEAFTTETTAHLWPVQGDLELVVHLRVVVSYHA